ncbi:NAD-dependent epimerase/dehydratase family protein [Methanoregula sp.]|uniref:NAD-dependent epimerase/dehydratase family protein n=1 Tax=Methanoregula sp. TaxID=2052170 RepID=UPI003C7747CE
METQRILVTGGAGFIGSRIIDYLESGNSSGLQVTMDVAKGWMEDYPTPFIPSKILNKLP